MFGINSNMKRAEEFGHWIEMMTKAVLYRNEYFPFFHTIGMDQDDSTNDGDFLQLMRFHTQNNCSFLFCDVWLCVCVCSLSHGICVLGFRVRARS